MTVSSSASSFRPGVCLSTNRPVSPYEGQVIYESDTDKTRVWNGSSWIPLSATGAPGAVPFFHGYLSGGNGAVTNNATIAYNAELFDDLGNFNTSTGVFTVPAGHDGVYSFTVNANCYNIGSSGAWRVKLITTGSIASEWNGSAAPALGSTDSFSVAAAILKLAVGDTVFCRWAVPASGNYSAGQSYNSFMGARIL